MNAADDPRFGLGYALAAYGVIFVTFFAYVGWLQLQQARMRRDLDELRRLLEAPGEPGRGSGSRGAGAA